MKLVNCKLNVSKDLNTIIPSDALVDVVRSYGSGLIFTTSIPPSTAAGAVTSINILAQQEGRELRLRHRSAYSLLREKLVYLV